MLIVILSVVFAILLLDFALIGFTPKILGIWGDLKAAVSHVMIEDTAQYSLQTDIRGRHIDSMINNRVGYKSLILTPDALIVRNTFLTYLLKIDINMIDSYEIEKALIGKRIRLDITIQNAKKKFEFSTNRSENWVKELSALNIFEKK